jgi:hypothetical protein
MKIDPVESILTIHIGLLYLLNLFRLAGKGDSDSRTLTPVVSVVVRVV